MLGYAKKAEIEVSRPRAKVCRSDREDHSTHTRGMKRTGGRNGGEEDDGSRGVELIRGGWKRDFPNARQPAEPNAIMRGEDFIMGRGTP